MSGENMQKSVVASIGKVNLFNVPFADLSFSVLYVRSSSSLIAQYSLSLDSLQADIILPYNAHNSLDSVQVESLEQSIFKARHNLGIISTRFDSALDRSTADAVTLDLTLDSMAERKNYSSLFRFFDDLLSAPDDYVVSRRASKKARSFTQLSLNVQDLVDQMLVKYEGVQNLLHNKGSQQLFLAYDDVFSTIRDFGTKLSDAAAMYDGASKQISSYYTRNVF